MIDHLSVLVSDMTSAKTFYLAALAPLGYALMMDGDGYCGIGKKEISGMWDGTIWLGKSDGKTSLHFALRADNRAAVDAFYKAALAAGGKDNGAPGIRAHYHENYYAAFVYDADGHNIEAVCHGAE